MTLARIALAFVFDVCNRFALRIERLQRDYQDICERIAERLRHER